MTVLGRALHADPAIGAVIADREKQALVAAAAELRRDPKAQTSPDFAEAIAKLELEAQKPRDPRDTTPVGTEPASAEVKP